MKPEIQTLKYYDWEAAWEFVRDKYGFTDEIDAVQFRKDSDEYFSVWNYIVERYEAFNGKPIHFSDWEFKHENGKFAYTVPYFFHPILIALMEEFGEIDEKCLTPNTKTATFISSW